MLFCGVMFLTIDIGTSSYKGHILTPSDQYSFQHVTDRTTSGAQAFYVEHAWYFDSLIVVGDRKHKENRVFDLRDVVRILNDPSKRDITSIRERWPFIKDVLADGDIALDIRYGDRKVDERVSKVITDLLAYVLERVLKDLNTLVFGVCYIVPYDYSNTAIALMRHSFEEAQIAKLKLVDERFATLLPYLYYGGIDRQDAYIFLMDYGDSCTTLSLARCLKGRLTFLSSKSLTTLSGRQLDRLLLKYIVLKYSRYTGSSLLADVPDKEVLLAESESAKIHLSSEDSVDVQLAVHGARRDLLVRRQEFEALLLLPLRTLSTSIQQMLRETGLHGEVVDSVIAVGGNAKIPAVSRLLESSFPFADHQYGRSIAHPATLGSSLLQLNSARSFATDPWCYRVFVDDQHFILVGRGLQTLTRDLLFYPVPTPKKGTTSLVKIIVERCLASELERALALPYKEAKEKELWRYVFGYHYMADISAAPRREDFSALSFGASNPFMGYKCPDLEVLTQECLEIMAHFLQDGRVVVSISQVHKGRYVPNSTLRFSFTDGKVIEYLKPHSGVMSENRLFAMNDEPYCTALTASTSLTASSVIPAVLSDRSTSAILEYSVKEDATLPEEKKKLLSDETVVVTCPNRFLRSRTMPELTNVVPAFAYSARSEFAHISYGAATDSRFLKKEELPRFVPPRRSPRNERLFFVGPPVASSPVTACVYSGTFRAGRREGKGMEFSANHSTVYQGDWLEDRYHGEGTLWFSDGRRLECAFERGAAEGSGRLFSREGAVVYEGGFARGEKSGSGTEYEEGGVIYTGEFRKGLRHGKGTLVCDNQCVYDGYWRNGLKHGKGKEVVGNTMYEGDFKRGLRHGQGVLTRLDSQIIYCGEWKWGKKDGEGKELFKGGIEYQGGYKDGRCEGKGRQFQGGLLLYEGEFVNGLREGKGTLFDDNGEVKMEGMFRRGKMNGVCTIVGNGGASRYTGEVVDDVPNGKGKEEYRGEGCYVGEFANGLRHGKGCFYNKEGELIYSGGWLFGLKHGVGELHDDFGLYSGEFVKGQKCGQGSYTLYSGDHYKGDFAEDLYNGRGEFTNVSGRVVYEGEWRDGQRHGEGKMFFGNGEYYQGEFVHDTMCGKGICFYENGMPKYVGSFLNDMRNGEGIEYKVNGEVLEQGFYVNNELVLSL